MCFVDVPELKLFFLLAQSSELCHVAPCFVSGHSCNEHVERIDRSHVIRSIAVANDIGEGSGAEKVVNKPATCWSV